MLNLLLSLIAYSQVPVLNKNGDTTICFTIEQSKFLAKEHYRAEECTKLKSICESQLQEKDLQINMYKKIQDNLENVINNQKSITTSKDDEIKSLKGVIDDKDKAIKKQKIYKWIAIIAGSSLSGYLGYKYITK